jgi:hypothetical protein
MNSLRQSVGAAAKIGEPVVMRQRRDSSLAGEIRKAAVDATQNGLGVGVCLVQLLPAAV